MPTSRRAVLAVAGSALAPGCLLGSDDDGPHVHLSNGDTETHYLHARFRGSDNPGWQQSATAYLRPGATKSGCETLTLGEYEGDELVVATRVDHGHVQRERTGYGFSSLLVDVDDDGSMSLSTGTT